MEMRSNKITGALEVVFFYQRQICILISASENLNTTVYHYYFSFSIANRVNDGKRLDVKGTSSRLSVSW